MAEAVTLPKICSSQGDNFHFERELCQRGYSCIAGVDEVGRGPLAGPVVAACVILPLDCDPSLFVDSKKTSQRQRLQLSHTLRSIGSTIGYGIVSHRMVDSINILQASLLAMKIAVHHLASVTGIPDYILVDGKFEIPLDIEQQVLVKGESKSASIAAASIVAKLLRDDIMDALHRRYPQYGFATNKGYPTSMHRKAIQRFGPSPYHRQTFKGVSGSDPAKINNR